MDGENLAFNDVATGINAVRQQAAWLNEELQAAGFLPLKLEVAKIPGEGWTRCTLTDKYGAPVHQACKPEVLAGMIMAMRNILRNK